MPEDHFCRFIGHNVQKTYCSRQPVLGQVYHRAGAYQHTEIYSFWHSHRPRTCTRDGLLQIPARRKVYGQGYDCGVWKNRRGKHICRVLQEQGQPGQRLLPVRRRRAGPRQPLEKQSTGGKGGKGKEPASYRPVDTVHNGI